MSGFQGRGTLEIKCQQQHQLVAIVVLNEKKVNVSQQL